MKKALAPASKQTQGQPVGVVDIVPRPFSFCKGSGSPCPITPPELEILPHAGPCGDYPGARGRGAPLSQRIARFLYTTPLAGPRCTFLGLHRVGDTVVTKSFLCARFCALWAAHTMPTNPFLCRHFSAFWARQGEFPIVKDTTPQTHAYITSRTLNFGGTSHETTDFL